MSEFLDMSGYAAYVWSAYGIAIGALVLNIWLARRQLRLARESARRRLSTEESP
nr:H570 [uncultured bacterium]